MPHELSDRAKLVLAAVVANYIATAEPVGSRTISKHTDVGVSAATVRNVMADLEEQGLLVQPHVSAGRVPTPDGLRLYVDSILRVEDLREVDKTLIREALLSNQSEDLGEVLKTAGKALSDINRLAAVVATPGPEQEVLRHMEFVALGGGHILVVLLSQNGTVQNRVIEVEENISQEDLDKYTRYLNELLADLTLTEVKSRVAREMMQEKNRFDEVLGRALALGQKALQLRVGGELIVQGRTNLMDAPEFNDVARLRSIFQAFEEKSTLLRLLEQTVQSRGVHILIGPESEVEGLEGVTAVSAPYGSEDSPGGALAVIGPTRMDYSKVIASVEFTARIVSRIMESRGK